MPVITRTAWTDDDGSGTTGTVINNAVKTELYNQIDALIAQFLSTGGVLTVNGFGTHTFSAGGASGNSLKLENTTSGAAAETNIWSKAGTTNFYIEAFSQGFTTFGAAFQSGASLNCDGAGGISFVAGNAAGVARFYTGGTTLRAQINANGTQTWAPYGAGTATFDASGNITSVSDARYKDRIAPLPYGLAEVLRLSPVQHGYNEASGLEREHLYGGFLAQDVEPVIPLAVGRDARGYLTLADRPILGAAVNAIKELDARLAALEAEKGPVSVAQRARTARPTAEPPPE